MRASLLIPLLALLVLAASCSGPNPPGAGVCPSVSGAGTAHGNTVSAAETWTAAGSPHLISSDLSVNAKVTLEPCALVTIAADKTVTVNTNGSIEAIGTTNQPITIKPYDGAGNWASIRLIGGTARIAHATLSGGGAPLNIVPDFQGALDVRSGKTTLTAPDPVLFVDHVTIEGSATQGVYAHAGGGFTPDSQALTITGSKGHAATFWPNLVETLPSGTYTGNARDDVMFTDDGNGQIRWDVTLHDRGVPYYSGGINQNGVNSVGAITGIAVLTIEPGVVWRFKKDTGVLSIDPGATPSRGVLIAKGTAQKPIVFTSNEAAPAAGDWLGVWMGGDDPRNSLDQVRIEYAGKLQSGSGSSSCQSLQTPTTHNGGALRVYHLPPTTLVTNTTFNASATNAIDRGWRDNSMPSLLSTNAFTNIALCNETFPRDMNGACPAPPLPCPK